MALGFWQDLNVSVTREKSIFDKSKFMLTPEL